MSHFNVIMAGAAAALFGMPIMIPPPLPGATPSYRRRHGRSGRDKHTQGDLTASANRGRLTKRGKRGYGLSPCDVSYPEAFMNSHARREQRLALFD